MDGKNLLILTLMAPGLMQMKKVIIIFLTDIQKSHFSFVWYLKVPDSSSGQLILEHPDGALIMTGLFDLERNDKNHYNSETMQITPSEGLMVMFPASLKHRVERYEGQAARVSLAFNGSFKQ